jgi:DNA-binding MurR/RpiR family transcriptional regulator
MVQRKKNNKDYMPKALKRRILQTFQRLPANHRRVADFILTQPHDLAFLTTDSLSSELKVSKATIVRFAQSLGYKGFTELQNEILDAVQSTIRSPEKYSRSLSELKPDETLGRVAEHEIRNITRTVRYVDRSTFSRGVDALLSAKRVFTMGIGISSLLAEVMSYELNQVGLDAQPLTSGRMRFVEHLALAGRDDVVVAFSFPPYSRETIDAARYARKRGCAVISITDKLTSPISFHSSHVLAVQTENMLHTNSVSAISVVINALVTEIAVKDKPAASTMFRESTSILEQTDEYVR